MIEAESLRIGNVSALVVNKFKQEMVKFGKPEVFRAKVKQVLKDKSEVQMARAIAQARAEASQAGSSSSAAAAPAVATPRTFIERMLG